MLQILMVDDDTNFTTTTKEIIDLLGHEVAIAASVAEAREQLSHLSFDILLLDIMLPDGSGFDVLDKLPEANKPKHIAFITGHTAIKTIVKSLAGPGVSYLLKPITLDDLKNLLDQALPSANPSIDSRHFGILIGESETMHNLYRLIHRVASNRANVLIQGESGTGKELVATAIHHASKCEGAFVAANCGAISAELIGSELFGHEKGAFTGATARKPGLFERAHNGTLFLDEITEMPLEMQPNLLRVLETGKVTRLGGTEEIPVNCRVISATNRSREQLAESQCLREDIYFRLAVFPVELTPLRDRKEDIAALCEAFLEELNQEYGSHFSLNAAELKRLEQYNWPGNVRELRHAIHRAFILTDEQQEYLQLPEQLGSPYAKDEQQSTGIQPGTTIHDMEKELITLTMEKVNGDKPKAAEMLGISLKTLYNRLNQYDDIVSA